MLKRRFGVFALCVALGLSAFAFVGCSSSDSTDDSTGEEASATDDASTAGGDNVLTVGFDQNFPPYGYVGDDGEYTGFDLDLAAEVAARNGWEVEYLPINWDAKDMELESGTIDCIWNGFTIEGREGDYEFTDAYMDNTQVIVVRADSGIETLADLAGRTVTAQADSAALNLLEEGGDQYELAQTFASLQTQPDYQTAFMDLEAGGTDAIAMDLSVANYQISGRESEFTILTDEPLNSEHYGVGFKLGNTGLRDIVQATLEEMVADGTVESICEKYEDQGISYDMWVLGI